MLRKVPFFRELDADDVKLIARHLKQRTIAPGEAIITEGESGTTTLFIARGVVPVLRKSDTGERELATLFAGDFFGEMALLNNTPRSATCRAATACALHELGRTDVETVSKQCPALGASLQRAAAERLEQEESAQP